MITTRRGIPAMGYDLSREVWSENAIWWLISTFTVNLTCIMIRQNKTMYTIITVKELPLALCAGGGEDVQGEMSREGSVWQPLHSPSYLVKLTARCVDCRNSPTKAMTNKVIVKGWPNPVCFMCLSNLNKLWNWYSSQEHRYVHVSWHTGVQVGSLEYIYSISLVYIVYFLEIC